MAYFAEEFVGKYSLSKTLKFGLVPVGETKKYLEEKDCPLLSGDYRRSKAYPVVKELLDKYYRFVIEKVFEDASISEEGVLAAYKAYADSDFKALEDCCTKLRVEVASYFGTEILDTYCLGEYKKLLCLEQKLPLPAGKKGPVEFGPSVLKTWMDNESGLTAEEIAKYSEAITVFDRFTSYFVGYKDIRENLFSAEDKASAISYRIINQNMLRFFDNISLFDKIKGKFPALYEELKSFEWAFSPATYCSILSQTAIDGYNYNVIGRPAADVGSSGVNMIINEYRQKNGINRRELPVMNQLYKQLLSDRDNGFTIDALSSEDEAQAFIREKYAELRPVAGELAVFINNALAGDGFKSVYIKSAAISEISQVMFGQWHVLRDALEKSEFADKKVVSLENIEKAFGDYILTLDPETTEKYKKAFDIRSYFTNPPFAGSQLPEKVQKVVEYKQQLDNFLNLIRFYKPLSLFDGRKKLPVPEDGTTFCLEFDSYFEQLRGFSKAYDKVRNFATQKPYSVDKIKLNFDIPSLLSGWDINKEASNASFLFQKDGKYYLGIADTEYKKIFELNNPAMKKAMASEGDCYEKIQYKQVSGFNKMLPKVVFSKAQQKVFGDLITERILEIREKKLYTAAANDRKAVDEWIDFMKEAVNRHSEWNTFFRFKFKETADYANANEFYSDLDKQAYNITKVKVDAGYVDALVSERKLYLFQLYCKDFSDNKKKAGTDNLHTMYWKCLFSDENLNALQAGDQPIIKLNGEGEIFLREPSIKYHATHPKNQAVANKNPLNPKSESLFAYDLAKNKRFTERKFFFHCPITINFRAGNEGSWGFNAQVNRFVKDNPDVNIIGVDRGEKNLLYYTIINQSGKILEHGSWNTIRNKYTAEDGRKVEKVTDYHELLERKEKARQDERVAWEAVENIKDLKAGYLSQVVHELTSLMVKYNAIVVLENLNLNFKRSRMKVEKQVYQKFEKALIDKLNYLVFKDKGYGEAGSFAQGLQLTAPFESFERLGRQTGVVYYVAPSYTSNVDPRTGFVNLFGLSFNYESVVKAQAVICRFLDIRYNAAKDWFEFSFDYKDFGIKDMEQSVWTACSHGKNDYWGYDQENKKVRVYNVTEELKQLFEEYGVDYESGDNFLDAILRQTKPAFFRVVLQMLKLLFQLRNNVPAEENIEDYILSPIDCGDGSFFDSRTAGNHEPSCAAANSAYHIALKGLMAIRDIDIDRIDYKKNSDRKTWFDFIQHKDYTK